MVGRYSFAAASISMLLGASPVAAQTVPADAPPPPVTPADATTIGADGRITYPAEFFATFAPSNALQVVQRVPGFTLDQGDTEVRGFGQAAGNVVINGQRPTSKSDTLDILLSRIPASRVARVEIGPGSLFGSEFAGKAQVVNLILNAAGGLAGTANATVRRNFTGKLFPEGSVSALLRSGASTFNTSIGLDNTSNGSTEEGTDTLTALPSGALVERRRKVNTVFEPYYYATAGWEYNGGQNRTAHLNGRYAHDYFALTQANDVFPVGGTIRNDRLTQRYYQHNYEIGGDLTRPLWGGGIKLIGLATRRDRDRTDVSLNRVQSVVQGGASQGLVDQRDERVARLVWNRSNWGGWSVELGGEGAFNRLDSDVNLVSIAANGTLTPINLPVDQAVVTEYRGEAFANAGRPLSSGLRLDLGLNYEASRLTVRGDARAERTLKFLKPKVTLDWRPDPKWHVQATVARTVAQLQFEDFIGAAELSNDRVNGGNADLLPQRAWESLVTIERTILGDGLLKLEGGYNRISLLQDRVPVLGGFDAPGNLGNGRTIIARASLDAPLGRWIKGARFTAKLSLADTSVTDPYTLRARRFSGTQLWNGSTGLRQDLGKFAWGFNVYTNSGQTVFRLNELDHFSNGGPYYTAFAEYRPSPKLTIAANLENAGETSGLRDRTFFTPSRSNPSPYLYELRERNKHIIPSLGVKYNFG